MFEHNFWYWVVSGASNVSVPVVSQLPVHASIDLTGLVTMVFGYGLPVILFLPGSFFHMQIFALVLGAIVILETARAVVAAYRWAVNLLPLP